MQEQNAPSSEAIAFSVVVPVYNSAGTLPELHMRLVTVLEGFRSSFELIFVDDSATDSSWETLCSIARTDERVRIIQLMKNVGQSAATLCGLARARGQIVFTIDDDLQHPPEELPKLLAALNSELALDVVIGVSHVTYHSLFRKLGSRFMHQMNSLILDKPSGLRFTAFRAMRVAVAAELGSQWALRPSIGAMMIGVTSRISNVYVEHHPRVVGRSGYSLRRILKQVTNSAIGYSVLPLRLLALLGIVGITVSFSLFAVYFARYVSGGISTPGFVTQALLLVALFGFNFLSFGILGEYVLRIVQVSERQPPYGIRAEIFHKHSSECSGDVSSFNE